MNRRIRYARRVGIWLLGYANKHDDHTKVILTTGTPTDIARYLSILQAEHRRDVSRQAHPSRCALTAESDRILKRAFPKGLE